MTGEMSNPVDPNEWPLQAAIAQAFRGELRAFDVYQGPYVLVQTATQGQHRIWVSPHSEHPDVLTVVYNETTETASEPFDRHQSDAEQVCIQRAHSVIPPVPMNFLDALALVTDLASQNTLDERDCDGDETLLEQARQQSEALAKVAERLDELREAKAGRYMDGTPEKALNDLHCRFQDAQQVIENGGYDEFKDGLEQADLLPEDVFPLIENVRDRDTE